MRIATTTCFVVIEKVTSVDSLTTAPTVNNIVTVTSNHVIVEMTVIFAFICFLLTETIILLSQLSNFE